MIARYVVKIRNRHDDNTWTMEWTTTSFGLAEAQTQDQLLNTNGPSWRNLYEIITIEKEYTPNEHNLKA